MADDVKVDLIPDLDKQIASLSEVHDVTLSIAKRIAEVARGRAPRETSNYAAGIIVQSTKTGARVLASDPKSAFIEFGVPGRNQPARWVLRSAATSLGLLSGGGREMVRYVSKAGRVSMITRAQAANYSRSKGA